jgi:Zn-dependent protease
MFGKREGLSLLIAIVIMSFALGFDDGSDSFEIGYWLVNIVMIFLMVGFSFIVHQLAHKLVARAKGFKAEFSLWGIKNLTFRPAKISKGKPGFFPRNVTILGKRFKIKSFPIGAALSVLVTLISNGAAFFLAVGQYSLFVKRGSRFGRQYVEVEDYEEAQISLAGPMAHILLMLIGSFFNTYGTFDKFIFINAALALFYMLPIHNLDGTKILFGSPQLYAFSLVFMVAMVVLVYFLPLIPLLIVSGIAGMIGVTLFYYFYWYQH